MDAQKTPLARSGRRTFLAKAATATAAATGLGVLARPTSAKAATQVGPLEITGSTPHLALIGSGTVGNFGDPGEEPSLYRCATNRLGVRASELTISPWTLDIDHSPTTGTYSSSLNLARDTINNDNTIHFCNSKVSGNNAVNPQTTFVIEQVGNATTGNDLFVKTVHNTLGDGSAQNGVFRARYQTTYPGETTPDDACHQVVINSNFGVGGINESWTVANVFANGRGVLGISRVATAPTTNPTAGVIVYVDASDNLVCRTKNGNIRTLALA